MKHDSTSILKDGRMLQLRSLQKQDTAAVIWLMHHASRQTPYLMLEYDEFALTVAREQAYLARMNDAPREAMIGAFIDGTLVGMANLSHVSPRERTLHRASVGVLVDQAYWCQGIGTQMMRAVIDLARAAGYEQLELKVVADNERAVRLYEYLGFLETGRLPRAMKYRDDSYADFLMMYLPL